MMPCLRDRPARVVDAAEEAAADAWAERSRRRRDLASSHWTDGCETTKGRRYDALVGDWPTEQVREQRDERRAAESVPARLAPRACGLHALVNERTGAFLALRCNSWGCRRCRLRLSRQWMARLAWHMFVPAVMVTVTVDPSTMPNLQPDTLAAHRWFSERLRRLWQRVRRWAAKRGQAWRYWRVLEYQKNGRLHAHALVEGGPTGGGASWKNRRRFRAWHVPPYRFAADWWRRAGRAVGLGICRGDTVCNPSDAACQAYCAKYLSKSRGRAHNVRCRLAQGSRGLRRVRPFGPSEPWRVVLGRIRGRRSAPVLLALGKRWHIDGQHGRFAPAALERAAGLPVHGLDWPLWLGEVLYGHVERSGAVGSEPACA